MIFSQHLLPFPLNKEQSGLKLPETLDYSRIQKFLQKLGTFQPLQKEVSHQLSKD